MSIIIEDMNLQEYIDVMDQHAVSSPTVLACLGLSHYVLPKHSDIFISSSIIKEVSYKPSNMVIHTLSNSKKPGENYFSPFSLEENKEKEIADKNEATNIEEEKDSVPMTNSRGEINADPFVFRGSHITNDFHIPLATKIFVKKEKSPQTITKMKKKKKNKNSSKSMALDTCFIQNKNILDNSKTNRYTLNFNYPFEIPQKPEEKIEDNRLPWVVEKNNKEELNFADEEELNMKECLVIENIPLGVGKKEVKEVLDPYCENFKITWTENNNSSTAIIYANCNLEWIMDCLQDSEPFGESVPMKDLRICKKSC